MKTGKMWFEVHDENGVAYAKNAGAYVNSNGIRKFADIEETVLFAKRLRNEGKVASIHMFTLTDETIDL